MSNFKKVSGNIKELIIHNSDKPDKELVWVNINNAGKNEIEYLRKKYGFKMLHLSASTAKATAQRSIVDKTENYLFIILHFPVLIDNDVVTEEIEFFVGKNHLVTLHNNRLKPLNELFSRYKTFAI